MRRQSFARAGLWVGMSLCCVLTLLPSTASGASIALVVDDKFHQDLQPEVERFAADIARDLGVTVVVSVVNGANAPAAAIRGRIKWLHANEGLLGTVLIGDIKTAYLGDYPSPGAGIVATDAYYEDLDDACWKDPDGNGVFNVALDDNGDGNFDWMLKAWIAEHNREVWSGRLQPPTGAPYADRVAMLRSYLDRNHAYRTALHQYARGMVYAESVRHNGDTSDGEDDQATIHARALAVMDGSWLFDRAAGDVLDFVWSDDLTQHMNLWLAGVHQPYEYAIVNVHGTPTGQWFGGANWLDPSSYRATPPNALLIDLASCSNGDFTAPDYLAGWMLFGGDALVVRANTTPTIYVGTLSPDPDLQLLSLGLTVGETRLTYVLSNESGVLLGDPTLRLRAPGTGSPISADRSVVVFPPGTPEAPGAGSDQVLLTNEGSFPVTVYHRITSLTSRDHRRPWDMQTSFNVPWSNGFPMTLQPGETRAVRVDFYYDASGPGVYRAAFLLYTDSPATPYLWIATEKALLGGDTTPPTVYVPASVAAVATSVDGAVVSFTVTADDAVSGPVDATCDSASGSVFAPGTTRVTCTAQDAAGNVGSASFDVSVTFAWTGVLPPVDPSGASVFKLGRTIPVKFALTGDSAAITDLVATIYLAKTADGILGTVESAVTTAAADDGSTFRYDWEGGGYILNLRTTALSAGTWSVLVDLGDQLDHEVQISLRP